MNVHFILVNPARAENVGFAARAIKTMGFQSLRLVGSNAQLEPGARKTGYGSHDILDQANVYNDLETAISDVDLIVGTTSKQRIKRYDYHVPSGLAKILNSKRGAIKQVAMVFGSEENGLSTTEMDQCDLISSIPLHTDYPSLNLAQSVLIYAWELGRLNSQNQIEKGSNYSLQGVLKEESEKLLSWLELDDKPILKRRILDRLLTADTADMELMLALIKRIQRKKDAF